MLSFLKNHPFAVEAYFERSLVLTFAVEKEQLERLIPECLALDVFDGRWAFLAIALVQTKSLRPKGFPEVLGRDFCLAGYRLFVRHTTRKGRRLRGLYILRSETDKRLMAFAGNIFTRYNYSKTDIRQLRSDDRLEFRSTGSNFRIEVSTEKKDVDLPEGSPFSDWKGARRFAGPLPFTFSYNPESREVLIIEGVRQGWNPEPVEVLGYHISFLDSLKLKGATLASAFVVKDIPYLWKKGRVELWAP